MKQKTKSTIFLCTVFLAMTLGMLCKAIFDAQVTGKKLEWRQFLVPLLISPLVYGTVFRIARTSDEKVLMLIFGFQNGFFWQDVFGSMAKGHPQ